LRQPICEYGLLIYVLDQKEEKSRRTKEETIRIAEGGNTDSNCSTFLYRSSRRRLRAQWSESSQKIHESIIGKFSGQKRSLLQPHPILSSPFLFLRPIFAYPPHSRPLYIFLRQPQDHSARKLTRNDTRPETEQSKTNGYKAGKSTQVISTIS
jgi:hypothetical protein